MKKTTKKGRKLTAKEAQKREEELTRLWKSLGRWNLDIPQLAEHFNVQPRQIYRDLKKIREKGVVIDAQEVCFELYDGFVALQNEARKGLYKKPGKDYTEQDRRGWANILIHNQKEMTAFLESFGIKEPSVTNVRVEAGVLTADDFAAAMEAAKKD